MEQSENLKKEISLSSWNRKEQFEFYKNYEIPYFNITANIDVSRLYSFAKKNNLSFFLCSLYFSTKVINSIPEFKYRIEKGKIFNYETIHAGSTILHDDESFSFCYFNFYEDVIQFCREGQKNIDLQNKSKELKAAEYNNVIHYSIIPWVSFTAFSHAKKLNETTGIPKIVFGKFFEDPNNSCKKMPVSVEVHHALMDGFHVGKYFQHFQKLIDTLQE